MNIKDFLLARIEEDEREANGQLGAEYYTDGAWPEGCATRVLAECAAKREIVERHGRGADPCDAHNASFESVPCNTLLALASVYADRPDYNAGWNLGMWS